MPDDRPNSRYRSFLRHHTHVTYPENSERRQQINTEEVIRKLDAIGMSHVPVPTIWDGVHLVDEGRLAGKNEITRRTQFTYRMRMWPVTRLIDGILDFSMRDADLYWDLANSLREVEFNLIKGKTEIDRAIANVAIIQTAKRSLAVGIPPDSITLQINWALDQVGGLATDEIELLECLPDGVMAQTTEQMDFDQMGQDRGIPAIQLVDNLETRGRIASLFGECFGGMRKSTDSKQPAPLSIRRLDLASKVLADASLEAFLRVSRIANEYVAFRPRFDKKMIPAVDGDQTRMRMMQSYDELPRMAPAAWAMKVAAPKYFRYRLATKSFMVREKIKRSDKKQFFYAMLDKSKSMQSGERIYKLLAILLNRLRAVGRGDAILGYSFFDAEVHEQMMVMDGREARQEIARLHRELFVGDDTDINLAIREGIKRIKEVTAELETDSPELVIVTDGDHGINVQAKELKGITLHAFVVEQENEDLIRLANETGGVALQNL